MYSFDERSASGVLIEAEKTADCDYTGVAERCAGLAPAPIPFGTPLYLARVFQLLQCGLSTRCHECNAAFFVYVVNSVFLISR